MKPDNAARLIESIIDSAFKMAEQMVNASNKLAQNIVSVTENALGELDKNASSPKA